MLAPPQLSTPQRRRASLTETLDREALTYGQHINNILLNPKSQTFSGETLNAYLPLPTSMAPAEQVFERLRDGVVLAHLMEGIKPGSVGLTKVNRGIDMSLLHNDGSTKAVFQAQENIQRVLKAAKDAGMVVVNIGPSDIIGCKTDLILGLLWQMIRASITKEITLASRPELIALLEPNETLTDLLAHTPETILIRWVNFHLTAAGSARRVKNLATDVRDSDVLLTILPRVIPPEIASRIDLSARIAEASAIGTKDLEEREKRAEIIIRVMEKSGVDAYTSARDIATSNPKMCLSLIAGLFNAHLGISIASESETREVVAEALEVTAEVEKAEEEACEAEEQAKGIEIEAQAAEVRATEEEAIVAKEVAEVEEAGTQQVANLETLLKELSEQIEFEKAAGAQALRQLILDLEAEETVLQQVTQEAENEEQEATRLNSEDRKRASAKLAGLLAELQEAEMNEEEELSKEQKSVEEECERTALELDEHRMLLQKQYLFVRQTMIQYVQQLKHVHRAETRTGMDGDDVFLSEEFGSRAAPSGENLAGESASNSGVAAHAQADSKYEISESNPNAFDDLDPSANQELALGLKQLIEQLVEANRSNIDRISKLTKKLERNERFLVLMDNKIGELSTEQEEYKRMSFSGKKKESTSGSRILSIFIK